MGPFPEPEFALYEGEESPSSRPETAEAQTDKKSIIELLRSSGEFFIEFFLGDQIEFQVPGFHKEVWYWFTSTALPRILLAIPREHAKTTLAKLGVIWYWLFTDHRFCIYLQNTLAKAKDSCRDIFNFLRCDNFISVFGHIRVVKESETENIWIFDLTMPNGRVKRCILRALGALNSVRGINVDNQRPDIAVVDDAEDEEIVNSPTIQQPKFDKWMFGSFLKALTRRRKIIWLGNMLTKTQLLTRLSKRPAWNPVVFGALVRNNATGLLQPLWPDRWPLEELIEDFQEYKDLGLMETWMCEMMNMPGHGANGFRQDQINYRPMPSPDGIIASFITIDPAFGEKQVNDSTCVACHVIPEEGPPMVVGQITGKMTEHEIFMAALELGTYWNAWVWGIEAQAAQKVLITLFGVYALSKGLVNRIEFVPLMSGGTAKGSRIKAWVDMMAEGEYAIHEGDMEITAQLLGYNLSKTKQDDDTIDSCAYGPQMLEQYMGLLISQFNGRQSDSIPAKFGRRVASV